MPPGEQKVLGAIAQYPDGVTRDQLGVLTGYKPTSRKTYIASLVGKGFVTSNNGSVSATQAGIDALGDDFEPLPTGDALLAWWRPKIGEGERKILDVVVAAYPNPIHRQQIEDATNYKPTSCKTYLALLSGRRLVVSDGRGSVKAAKELFS